MAYALGFPKDVTEVIYSMRDWRWEMVRAGGKTPSAYCFETQLDEDTSDKSKHYIDCSPPMPEFSKTIPKFRIWRNFVPNCEERLASQHHLNNYEWFTQFWAGSIDVWSFRDGKWKIIAEFQPTNPRVKPRVASLEDLWWQCEPC